ncbi:hypothetical protein B0H17DRAFT_1177051 [Mycena rosella]|uniref:Uncharacterized protein n=1 Tax=Mycena rosella TaxID=1033263 RepID=A0AAD7DW30_MYCRO|nr:hypothetical protein B0H17DRAFT_1177051 [Mycena rosella]
MAHDRAFDRFRVKLRDFISGFLPDYGYNLPNGKRLKSDTQTTMIMAFPPSLTMSSVQQIEPFQLFNIHYESLIHSISEDFDKPGEFVVVIILDGDMSLHLKNLHPGRLVPYHSAFNILPALMTLKRRIVPPLRVGQSRGMPSRPSRDCSRAARAQLTAHSRMFLLMRHAERRLTSSPRRAQRAAGQEGLDRKILTNVPTGYPTPRIRKVFGVYKYRQHLAISRPSPHHHDVSRLQTAQRKAPSFPVLDALNSADSSAADGGQDLPITHLLQQVLRRRQLHAQRRTGAAQPRHTLPPTRAAGHEHAVRLPVYNGRRSYGWIFGCGAPFPGKSDRDGTQCEVRGVKLAVNHTAIGASNVPLGFVIQ